MRAGAAGPVQRSASGVATLVRLAGVLSLAIGVVAPLQVVVMASGGLSPAVVGLVFGSFAPARVRGRRRAP